MGPAESLTARMDALAHALRAAGVAPDRIATILGSAATATMHALVLDGMLEQRASPEPRQEPQPVEAPVRLAA